MGTNWELSSLWGAQRSGGEGKRQKSREKETLAKRRGGREQENDWRRTLPLITPKRVLSTNYLRMEGKRKIKG